MSPAAGKPIEWVSEDIIRQLFNEVQSAEKVSSGEYIAVRMRNGHPDKLPAQDPPCTHSQIYYYHDAANQLIAVVHQYQRPDGTLGGHGKPDPKRIILPDRIHSVKSKLPPDLERKP